MKNSNWIEVSKVAPEFDQDVIVAYKTDTRWFKDIGHLSQLRQGAGYKHYEFRLNSSDYEESRVTHWQPLPEDPQ